MPTRTRAHPRSWRDGRRRQRLAGEREERRPRIELRPPGCRIQEIGLSFGIDGDAWEVAGAHEVEPRARGVTGTAGIAPGDLPQPVELIHHVELLEPLGGGSAQPI